MFASTHARFRPNLCVNLLIVQRTNAFQMASAVPEGNAAVAGPPTATMPTASIAENPEEHQQMKYEMRTATVFPIVESGSLIFYLGFGS